jgi:hypothetical protein
MSRTKLPVILACLSLGITAVVSGEQALLFAICLADSCLARYN